MGKDAIEPHVNKSCTYLHLRQCFEKDNAVAQIGQVFWMIRDGEEDPAEKITDCPSAGIFICISHYSGRGVIFECNVRGVACGVVLLFVHCFDTNILVHVAGISAPNASIGPYGTGEER